MSVGPVLAAVGLALLHRVNADGSYLGEVLPAVGVLGFGLAITVAPLTSAVLQAAPDEHTGIASAVNNDVARGGSLIAVAVLPPLAGITGSSYLHPQQLSSGFHTAVLLAASACALGGLLAVATIRNPRRPQRARSRQLSYCGVDAPPLQVQPYRTMPS
jgi:MFS family permease